MSEDRSNFTDDRWSQDKQYLGFGPSDNPSGSGANWSLEDAQWADSHTRSKQEALAKLQSMATSGTSEPLKFGAGGSVNPAWFSWQQNQRDLNYAKEDAQSAKDKQDYQDWQVGAKLKQAVKDSQDQKTGQMLDSSLADHLSKAAVDIMGYGDVKKGFETLALSKKYGDSASASEKENVALASSKMSLGNDILATVNDEASFQNAKVQMAGLGPTFAIPPQYATYDDNAKGWVDNRRQFSARGIAAAKVQLATLTAANTAEVQANRILTDQAKEARKATDEQLARNPKQKILAPADQAEYQSQLSTFIPDTWDKVDTPSDRAAAAQNWSDKTAIYISQGMPADQAKIKAAGDVKLQISSEGKFVPQAKGTTISGAGIAYVEQRMGKDGIMYGKKADGTIEKIK